MRTNILKCLAITNQMISQMTEIYSDLSVPPHVQLIATGVAAISVVFGLFGNTVILAGSLSHNAVNLHKKLTIFIRQLALLDLLITLTRLLTGLASLVENEWVFGDWGCSVTFFMFYSSQLTSCCLIAVLATAAFLLAKFPGRFESWLTTRVTYSIIVAAWWISLNITAIPLLRGERLTYKSWPFTCELTDEPDGGTIHLVILSVSLVWSLISTLLCVVAWLSLPLSRSRRRDVKTVFFLSLVHCLLLLPIVFSRGAGDRLEGHAFQLLQLIPLHLIAIYKFHVYYLILPRFRDLVRSLVASLTSCCRCTRGLTSCCGDCHGRLTRGSGSRENLINIQENQQTENRTETDEERGNRVEIVVAQEVLQWSEEGVNVSGRLVLEGQGARERTDQRNLLQVLRGHIRQTVL